MQSPPPLPRLVHSTLAASRLIGPLSLVIKQDMTSPPWEICYRSYNYTKNPDFTNREIPLIYQKNLKITIWRGCLSGFTSSEQPGPVFKIIYKEPINSMFCRPQHPCREYECHAQPNYSTAEWFCQLLRKRNLPRIRPWHFCRLAKN